MQIGHELEPEVHEPEHIETVLAELKVNFSRYFGGFAEKPLKPLFKDARDAYEKERDVYLEYLNPAALEEFEYDPNAFKSHTRRRCPIIRRCLMSQDVVMKSYKRSFNDVSGRQLLEAVRNIVEFGANYVRGFDHEEHESAQAPSDLGLEPLNESANQCTGVIGYGIQSTLLYSIYARAFAHRSQAAVWTLYFLSGRKDFGLADGSEFLMVDAKHGTCEQNYFYPAELFSFYSLKLYLMLKEACAERDVPLYDYYRYTYLDAFTDYVGETHREDIECFRWSSEDVESRPWF